MLNGKLELHDVRDTEALCVRVIQMSGLELNQHEREELLAYLVALAWELSLEYEPGIIRRGFSLWVTTTLRRRVVDWQRNRSGRTKWQFKDRTYERPRTQFLSYEQQTSHRTGKSEHLDTPQRELAKALKRGYMDVAESSSVDLMRALGKGSGGAARRNGAVGKEPHDRAA